VAIMKHFIALLLVVVVAVASASSIPNKRSIASGFRQAFGFLFEKSTTGLLQDCIDDIPLPHLPCSIYANGPRSCDNFCKQIVVLPDLRDCVKEKAKRQNPKLDDLEFEKDFSAVSNKFFSECSKVRGPAPAPSMTIAQATQESFAFCMKNAGFFGRANFLLFTMPKLCSAGPEAVETGNWLMRCLRVGTLVRVVGSDATEQVAEVQTRLSKERQAAILDTACKTYREFKQLTPEKAKEFLAEKMNELKAKFESNKWNVVSGRVVEASPQEKERAEKALQTVEQRDDDDIFGNAGMAAIVPVVGLGALPTYFSLMVFVGGMTFGSAGLLLLPTVVMVMTALFMF